MMAGAAHDPVFAKKVGVPTKVAREFNKADDKSGFLSSAMRAKGPAYQEGGKVKKYAEGSLVSDKQEELARRQQEFLDKIERESASTKAKREEEERRMQERRRKAPPPKSDRFNPDRATIVPRIYDKPPQYAKGGGVKGKGAEQRGTRPAKYY